MSANTTARGWSIQDARRMGDLRLAWNLAADQRPTAIAEPATVDEVIAAVNYAREAGLRVAPQSTGHGVNALAAGDGTMVVKLEIDAWRRDRRRLGDRSGAGRCAMGRRYRRQHAEHGLAALAGSSRDVGVPGTPPAAGSAGSARRHGLACNTVRAVEVVTANGELVRADARYQPGSVLGGARRRGRLRRDHRLRARAVPVDRSFGGNAVADRTRHRGAQTWREWIDTVPDEVTSLGRLLHLPPIPDIPEPFRGRDFVAVEAMCLMDAAGSGDARAATRARPGDRLFAPCRRRAREAPHGSPGPVPGIGEGMVLDRPHRRDLEPRCAQPVTTPEARWCRSSSGIWAARSPPVRESAVWRRRDPGHRDLRRWHDAGTAAGRRP